MRLTNEEIKKCGDMVGWELLHNGKGSTVINDGHLINQKDFNQYYYPHLLNLTIEAIMVKENFDILYGIDDYEDETYNTYSVECIFPSGSSIGFNEASWVEAKEKLIKWYINEQLPSEESIPEITSELIIELSKSVNKAMEQFNKDVKAVVNKMTKELGNAK